MTDSPAHPVLPLPPNAPVTPETRLLREPPVADQEPRLRTYERQLANRYATVSARLRGDATAPRKRQASRIEPWHAPVVEHVLTINIELIEAEAPTTEEAAPIYPTIADIQETVAALYGFSVTDLLSDRRHAMVVLARHVAIYLAKKLTTRSLAEIGRRFGRRDHTTIIHAVGSIESKLKVSETFRQTVEQLGEEILREISNG